MGNRAGLCWRAHVASAGANHCTDNTHTMMQAWSQQKVCASGGCGATTVGTIVTFTSALKSSSSPGERALRPAPRSPHTDARSWTLQIGETGGTSS